MKPVYSESIMDESLEKICSRDVELLGQIKDIHGNEAMGIFFGIMVDALKPYYKELELEPPGVFKILVSPIYADLVDGKKPLVRMYFDRKVEILEDNENVKRVCNEMVSMTNGNFRIYPKGALKYLF